MDKITDLQLFQKRYNECLEKEEGWCYACIPEVTMRMNEKYNENYSEEQIENYLFGESEISEKYYELIN
jgi:hypothetical protein